MVDGVRHIEIDAVSRLDLARRLRISSTPTVLVLGPDGGIVRRAVGLPRKADVLAALGSVILLPGESTGIKPFSRDDVKALCGTPEQLRKVENWDEVILLYGKIVYEELVGESEANTHETGWCCWYIHGRQNSGMVTAGSPAYNQHT